MEITKDEIKSLEEGMEEGLQKLIPNAKVKIIIPQAEELTIQKQLKKDTLDMMDASCSKLCEIIKPINVTKLAYKDKIKFLDNDGFGRAWDEIKKIITAHQCLRGNL